MSKKMTIDEIAEMFGGEIPMEAVQFLFVTAPPDMTLREVRNELEEMAERYRAKKQAADKDLPSADDVRALYAVCDGEWRKEGFGWRFWRNADL